MGHSSAVGLLGFLLCLIAFWSVSAASSTSEGEPTAVTQEQARAAVEDAQKSTKDVFEKAESEVNKNKGVLERIEALNVQTEKIKSQADEAAAKAEKMKPVNSKAAGIVTNIRNTYTKVNTLYLNTVGQLKTAVESLDKLLVEATSLKGQSNITIENKDNLQNHYTGAKTKASDIKNQTEKLDVNITATLTIIGAIPSPEETITQSLKDAQLSNLHVSCIVAVANITSVMRDAGSIITNTQNTKEQIYEIVEQMKKLATPALSESNNYIQSLFTSADDELTKANGAVDSATQAMTEMTEQQKKAGDALTTIEKATDVSAAEAEVRKAEACVATVQQSFLKLQSTLQTGKNFVTKANDAKQKLVSALTTTTTKPSTDQITATENANPPVGDGTERDQKDTKIQPTSTDSLNQGNNSAEKIKDALSNSAQNIPTTLLTGGKVLAPGSKNDSAMTVSVPLLVALIASAVWQ